VVLARPVKAPFPNLGTKCGRRERGTGAWSRARGNSRQKATLLAAVEGILVRWKAVTFAGDRRNADLGTVRF
jgi:hypothetical protein